MNTVWTFGDSLTEGFRSNETWAKDYIKWKGYVPLTYGEIISKELNFELVNLGKGGSNNYSIFESFIKNIENIKKDDIVILGWSEVTRYRLANKYNKWVSFVPNFDHNFMNIENISRNTAEEILVNRQSKVYIDEVNIWIKFLKYVIKDFKIINWSTFNDGEIDGVFVTGVERILDETNGDTIDGHFSEKGQMELAEILIREIKKP